MEPWLKEAERRIRHGILLSSTDFGKALAYIRKHWDGLAHYLCDPEAPIDNNPTEQLMRHVSPNTQTPSAAVAFP